MPLRACIQSHTHREYRTSLAWLDEQLDRPSRSDNYLMQIAAEVRRILRLGEVWGSKKKPATVDPNDMKLKFVKPKPKAIQKTTSETQARSKAGWLASVFGKKKT